MMNPNFRELGDKAFNPDGSINMNIDSCLTCQYFESYQHRNKTEIDLTTVGFCTFPLMIEDETYGLGMVCDIYSNHSANLLS